MFVEITAPQELVYRLIPKVDLETARARVEEKKIPLLVGALGALFTRPKSEDIELIYTESRLEPFWQASIQAHIVYERQCSYAVPVADANMHKVTLLGQAIAVQAGTFTLAGTEHGESRQMISQTLDGKGLHHADLVKLVSAPKEVITDLAHFRPEGVLVVPPEVVASGIIARIIHQIARPTEPVTILEEHGDVELVALYFRPVYAFEFHWPQKSRYGVIEFDGLSGEISHGQTRKDLTGTRLNPEGMFDVSDDALAKAIQVLGPSPSGGGNVVLRLVRSLAGGSHS